MPNMSYCRFENTLSDMRDCLEAAQDLHKEGSEYVGGEYNEEVNEYERRAIESMVDVAEELAYVLKNLVED